MCPVKTSQQTVRLFLERAPSVRVLVVGDVMLDAYVSGDATRISPEAPVPVVSVAQRRYVPGGAANVAANVCGVGSRVVLAGATGVDDAAVKLRLELNRARIKGDAVVEDATRPTTTKTRITAGGQQIVRFDEEDRSPLSGRAAAELKEACQSILSSVDACVISDYAKGVINEPFCRWFIQEAVKHGKPVVADPKSRDLIRYQGASVVTPNLMETAAAAGVPIEAAEDLAYAASLLLRRITPSALLVTRGADGMSLFEQNQEVRNLPALMTEVSDVTGAGDTVAAVLAVALGSGLALSDAARVANIAAGVAVRHVGTWAVRGEELLEAGMNPDLARLEASSA
jgi:rfaE bifunctional protein kinase chain/domain